MTSIETLMRDSNPMMDPSTEFSEEEIQAFDLLVRSRSGNMDVKQVETPSGQEKKRYPGWLVAAAAFAAVVVVGFGIGLVFNAGSDSSTDVIDTPTTTTQPATATTVPLPFTADQALAVAEDYFAEFNAGGSEAVMALFTPDATFTVRLIGDQAEPTLRAFWEERLVWNMAQGTIMTPHECAVTDEAPGAVTISCEHGTHDAPAQAVGGPYAVPTTTTMKVMPDGIGEFDELYGSPDFTYVGERFDAWMTENNPADALAAGFGNWSSLDEASENGRILAQYAEEWAAELQAAGCTFNQLTEC